MKLGILVTRDTFAEALIGLTKAALDRGHEVIIFLNDDGTRLCLDPGVTSLASLPGVTMSLCDLNAKARDIAGESIGRNITVGSQYQNSLMINRADKVIVI